MKKYAVYTRFPNKTHFDLVHEGEVGDDEITTWDELAKAYLNPGEFHIPGTQIIVTYQGEAVYLLVNSNYQMR